MKRFESLVLLSAFTWLLAIFCIILSKSFSLRDIILLVACTLEFLVASARLNKYILKVWP